MKTVIRVISCVVQFMGPMISKITNNITLKKFLNLKLFCSVLFLGMQFMEFYWLRKNQRLGQEFDYGRLVDTLLSRIVWKTKYVIYVVVCPLLSQMFLFYVKQFSLQFSFNLRTQLLKKKIHGVFFQREEWSWKIIS